MQKTDLAATLADKFHYESNFQTATPSGNYFWFRKRQQVADLIQKNTPLLLSHHHESDPFRFVDIGCGDGIDIFLIRQLLNPCFATVEYVGLDGNPTNHYVSLLRRDYFQANDVHFKMANLTSPLPFDDRSIDFAYCSEVVEHLLEPEVLLEEIKRVLKPKGFLLLTTPHEPNIFQKAFWSKTARQNLEASVQRMREHPEVFYTNNEQVFVYGHISCRTNAQWDQTLQKYGFLRVDYRRGAMVYGANPFHDRNLVLGLRLLFEAFLDILPKGLTRSMSDQLIALYQCN